MIYLLPDSHKAQKGRRKKILLQKYGRELYSYSQNRVVGLDFQRHKMFLRNLDIVRSS